MSITREDFHRLYPKLKAVLQRAGTSEEEACEIAQEALLEAHRSFENFKGNSELDTWIVSIAKNCLLQHRRNQGRLKRTGVEVPLDASPDGGGLLKIEGFEDQVIARDLVAQASRAVARLPEEQQQALLLKAQGFTGRKIAKILGTTENRANSLIHQARTKLRRELQAKNPQEN